MAYATITEHLLSLSELSAQYPSSRINIDEPSKSLGLTSTDAQRLLIQYGENKIAYHKTTMKKVKNALVKCIGKPIKNEFYSFPSPCHIIRDGNVVSISSVEVVPGDLVQLKTNDTVPADIRIIECNDNQLLTVYMMALTSKDSYPRYCTVNSTNEDIMETKNLCFAGFVVQEGQGLGLVVRTGLNTMLGRLVPLMAFNEN
ncbi:unnamed protein product [Didymodactylos carnosus]|uniref:P-type ATPase A domain-containing protein n=1 Tax=Didymodactylos carnosus TaxID=1234261 RepID=A0A813X2J7_9BILA|nr:unnamed protein product [Didymodactylos carnosus]CAF1485719.1 unnamed protein product [Didymodactylos carnosus]CAF3651153.1 unnamed protein product [Didymodactylos carnosus]CAF4275635.1 unnamed protein product [Didymodactylos carnosus]